MRILSDYFTNYWHWSNFVVIIVYLFLTTYVGKVLSQRQSTLKDFFLGGKKLPWMAVCGSVIATEISAVTFIIVPMMIYKVGGDFTYLMLAFGTILARFIIGYWFLPVYFEKEIYSPYQYMGNRLGKRVDKLTSLLFIIGAVLGQGVRVFTIAIVLEVVLKIPLSSAIFIIGLFSVIWTLMGGITTVVWTDVVQFIIFIGGAIAAFVFILFKVPGGMSEVLREGAEAGKFTLWNFSADPTVSFTLWCGLFGTSFLTLASHGMDQMNTQRLFCCRDVRDARKAIIWSGLGVLVTVIMLFVGAGIFAYYRKYPLEAGFASLVNDDMSRIFPVFIVHSLPKIFSGLLISAVLAAAISSLDSTLAALSQTAVTGFYKPYLFPGREEKHYLRASRIFVVFWGAALCLMALVCKPLSGRYGDIVQLALAMTSYTYGALLGTFFLGFFNTRRDDFGLLWGIPFSMLIVFALSWHNFVANWFVTAALSLLVLFWILRGRKEKVFFPRTLFVILVAAVVLAINAVYFSSALQCGGSASLALPWSYPDSSLEPQFLHIAWPWNFPIGVLTTFVVGYVIGRKKER